MNDRQKLIKLVPVACLVALSLSFLMSSPPLQLLEEKDIQLVANRTNTRSLFTIKLDDFGQPISYGPLIPDDSIKTMAGATSQQQILQDQLEEVRQEVENTQDELEILKIQKNILIEESSAFVQLIEAQYLTPLEEIKSNLEALGFTETEAPMLTLDYCLMSIHQFIQNPNQNEYENSLEMSLNELNAGLNGEETSGFIETFSRFLQSGKTKTKLSLQLTKAKDLLIDFKDKMSSQNNSEIEAFKKTKRQQIATEDAISTKYIELDELILELSGILEEIEEITQ